MPPIPTPFTFRDRAILITGANRGLGAALCETILQYSPQIIYAGYRKNPGAIADDRVRWIPLDILQKDSIADLSRNMSGLDVVINNAGNLIPADTDPCLLYTSPSPRDS